MCHFKKYDQVMHNWALHGIFFMRTSYPQCWGCISLLPKNIKIINSEK